MNDLIEKIKDLIEEYKDAKVGNIELDSDTDFEIHKEVEKTSEIIVDHLEELGETIDAYIETMNEPSDYENDLAEDNYFRNRDIA